MMGSDGEGFYVSKALETLRTMRREHGDPTVEEAQVYATLALVDAGKEQTEVLRGHR